MRYRSSLALAAGLLAPIGCRGDTPVTTTYFANNLAVEQALRPYCHLAYTFVRVTNESASRPRQQSYFITCEQFAGRDHELWVEVQAKRIAYPDQQKDVCAIRFGPVRGGSIPLELIRAVASEPALGSLLAAELAAHPDREKWQATVHGIRVIRSDSSRFSYVALEGCEVAPADPSDW